MLQNFIKGIFIIGHNYLVVSTVKRFNPIPIITKILSFNRPTAETTLPIEHWHQIDRAVSVSRKIEKSSCYREISNELITSEWPMRTHNRQQMADAMPDADAVSPVIESTLSVSIMGRGRCGWLLFGSHTP